MIERHAAGDSAGAIVARNAMLKAMGVNAKDDTVKARDRCGREPVKPKWLVEAGAQLPLGNGAMAEARKLEKSVPGERAAKSGLTEVQFGLAHERILAFMNADGTPASSWKFSGSERDLLKKRLDKIRKAVIG